MESITPGGFLRRKIVGIGNWLLRLFPGQRIHALIFDPKGTIKGFMEDEMSEESKCLNMDYSFGRLRYGR